MARKRSAKLSNSVTNSSREDFYLNVNDTEDTTELDLYYKNILFIQIFNAITVIYGVIFLYLVLNDDNYLYIGNASFLLTSFFHGLLEFLKLIIHRKFVLKTALKFNICYFQFVQTYISLALLCHLVTVLFGADLIENIEKTFVFSCTLVSFIIIPLYFDCGTYALSLLTLRENPKTLTQTSMLIVSFSSVMGAWFGAFVIPLDWDRKWQVWPIPCAVGSLSGFVIGHMYSFVKMFQELQSVEKPHYFSISTVLKNMFNN